jgi:aspartyl-tRNA(Asn)/glutamyl-tRNA(Gln) amidotransferase subunit A
MVERPASSRERLERALDRIDDPSGEGARAFLTLYRDEAREAADAADRRAADGTALGPLDGVIVSIKDLFDVAGEPTRAGSTILSDAPAATRDAPVVRRLREAGAVIVGKTNMSEFAFTGVGMNPHYGTPVNPADRTRVPGGSSSGSAVSAANGMCEIAIGTDTGGSTRIPAALCGIVGFKPTKSRVPTDGAYPLSPTLDSVGPLAPTVAACAAADAVLAGESPWNVEPMRLAGLNVGILDGEPLSELDATVANRFEEALAQLGGAGARLSHAQIAALEQMAMVQAIATIATAEAYRIHEQQLAAHGDEYDSFIRRRIEGGRAVSDAAYAEMLRRREELVTQMDAAMSSFDALVLPTTPIVAPTMDEISSDQRFRTANRLLLRNTAIANFFDLCAISLPIPGDGLPVGLMLFGRRGADRRLFRIAASIERRLRSA